MSSTGPFIVYGVVELSANGILSPEWIRKSFDMNLYLDSNENPVYGIECSFDVERGISSITKRKKEIVGKFLRMYNEKYKAARPGYYIVNILENTDKIVYSLDDDNSDEESDSGSEEESDSDDESGSEREDESGSEREDESGSESEDESGSESEDESGSESDDE